MTIKLNRFYGYNNIVIIGSSPLLLMTALSFSRQGKNVTVISEQKDWGGSWNYSNYLGQYIDTSCHLLESYKVAHEILRKYNVDLVPYSKADTPIKVIPSKDILHISNYHNRHKIAMEFLSKSRTALKYLIKLVFHFKSSAKNIDFFESLSDLFLFIRYRFGQILFFEPICRPVGGCPSLIQQLTRQLETNNIAIIDDRVVCLEDIGSYSTALLSSGDFINADLVVSGQSTLLNLPTSKYDTNPCDASIPSASSLYTHFLVEVTNLPENVSLPFYIHFPCNKELHRITYSHTSFSANCYLVQTRRNNISITALKCCVESIFFELIKKMSSEPIVSTCFNRNQCCLNVRIIKKFTPHALPPHYALNVKPALVGRHLILRTYGDLARNIAHHCQLFI